MHHCTHWLWWWTAHSPHSQLLFWRNPMESSWGLLSAAHFHQKETILGHHLIFKAHSVTESQQKSKDTGYFIGLNYPETVDYFWKHTHIYIHSSSSQDPSTMQLHSETKLILKIPTPLWEVNIAKPGRASKVQEIIFCIMMAQGYAFQIFAQVLTAQ